MILTAVDAFIYIYFIMFLREESVADLAGLNKVIIIKKFLSILIINTISIIIIILNNVIINIIIIKLFPPLIFYNIQIYIEY